MATTKKNASLIQALCSVCMTFPAATQDVKWGDVLVFSVGAKMFAATHTDMQTLCFKVDPERFLELTDRPGIIPAPYLARNKWVQIVDPTAVSRDESVELLKRSYQLVFAKLTKKLQREIGHE
jgi:predicted DNA-binding protein (MmcQ/YjbR family)